jgi:D-amino-acid oxidase
MSKVLVVGAGTIGLRTALELTRRNVQVTLRAPRHPLDPTTCSMGAGGLWMPVFSPDPRTNGWALETLQELWPMASGQDDEADSVPLVEKLMAVVLKRDHSGPTLQDYVDHQQQNHQPSDKIPSWASDPKLEFQHLTVEMLAWQNTAFQLRIPPEQELKQAGYMYAWLFRTLVVDAPRMLEHMLKELGDHADVNVETNHNYESLDEMIQGSVDEGCDTLVNCTGPGAATLCSDEQDLVGGRGVLQLYDRKSTIRRPSVSMGPYGAHSNDAVIMADDGPWATETMPCYLIPRGNVIALGGSMLKYDTKSVLRDSERAQLQQNAHRMGINIDACKPISEWTGYRPYRPTIRVEVDEAYRHSKVKVVHNYGHGGSGWTINVGCARECADLITGPLQ